MFVTVFEVYFKKVKCFSEKQQHAFLELQSNTDYGLSAARSWS